MIRLRAKTRTLLSIIVLFIIVSACVPAKQYAPLQLTSLKMGQTSKIELYGNAGWRDTGIQISKGQVYRVNANGAWSMSPFCGSTDSEGLAIEHLTCMKGIFAQSFPLPEGRIGALVGKIGQNGKVFLIGGTEGFIADREGILFLRNNDPDGFLFDNEGQIDVAIQRYGGGEGGATATASGLKKTGQPAKADIDYIFANHLTLDFDDGGASMSGEWTEDEKLKVARYFEMATQDAPDITTLLGMGSETHGPIRVIKRDAVKWSLGLVKRSKDHLTHYLVLNEHFFDAYDTPGAVVVGDAIIYSYWFFIHELVHLAELRSTPIAVFSPSLNLVGPVGPALVGKIEEAKKLLEARGIDYDEYVLSTEESNLDLVHSIGLPSKYAIREPQETLAEVVTAMILAPSYQPTQDVRDIIDHFFHRSMDGVGQAYASEPCRALGDAASKGDTGKMSALINSGINVNCTYTGSYVSDEGGKTISYSTTPLNEAAYLARVVPVKLLLSHGANVNYADAEGYKPLDAVSYALDDMVLYEDTTPQEWEEGEAVFQLLEDAGATYK
ncbi:MAG: hypothetical protein HN644_06840 [Rhodospirillales bacterium]|jgi:hypothetical protein|nr:hypothetical protein [Rhodospirillales bacterium]MBT4038473.1 hypothetical protein [Rhodospirillales bacterium]MBT4625672.1 hypothetical protein [Rhodospirillales bacterium]MBT5351854.1 hypothetical protein [Rhodospirillales bacterium]MBT5522345.1 hypothetical protein [Rhodospirillales bacterium]